MSEIEKEDQYQYEGGSAGCEREENCCLCFPIKCGVTTLCLFGALAGISSFFGGLNFMFTYGAFGTVFLMANIPQIVAGLWYFQYLVKQDTKETRHKVINAGRYTLYSIILVNVVLLLGYMSFFSRSVERTVVQKIFGYTNYWVSKRNQSKNVIFFGTPISSIC